MVPVMELVGYLGTAEIVVGLFVTVIVWVVVFVMLVKPYQVREKIEERGQVFKSPQNAVGLAAPTTMSQAVRNSPEERRLHEHLREVQQRLEENELKLADMQSRFKAPPGQPSAPGSAREMDELKAKLDEALKVIRHIGL